MTATGALPLSVALTRPRTPARCQACGAGHRAARPLSRWVEHDERDHETAVVVVLCQRCATELIEPHPRLYRPLQGNEPWPGCMGICVACRHRSGTACKHLDSTSNGGPGLALTIAPPTVTILCGGRGRGHRGCQRLVLYNSPASACAGRAVIDDPQG